MITMMLFKLIVKERSKYKGDKMSEIIIVSHGQLAEALKSTAAMFFGEQAQSIITLSLTPEDTPEILKDKLNNILSQVNDALIFTDLFGGTPANVIALEISQKHDNHIECITGVNLPLVMEALGMCESKTAREMKINLLEKGKNSILSLNDKLVI